VVPEVDSVIQESLDTDAVQPDPIVTLKDPLPPAAATDAELDDSEYEQAEESVTVKDTLPNWVPLSKM
jgi:hypothetical protein